MKLIQNKLSSFFYTRKTGNWVGFFRVAIGILVLSHFIAILPDFDLLYSTTGLIASDIQDVYIPNFILTLPKIINFFNDKGIPESNILFFFKISYIIVTIALIYGFLPRLNAIILLILHISLVKGAELFSYGIDYFTSMSLLYLILIPSNKNIFKPKKKQILNSHYSPFLRLLQLHLSISYFFSGFTKVLGFNWWNGESIWKAINLPYSNLDFGFNLSLYGEYPIIFIIIGWGTILSEMFYPIFIWLNKTRKLWLYLIISMHLGIALILNLYFFSTIMIIWNLTAFYFPYTGKKAFYLTFFKTTT